MKVKLTEQQFRRIMLMEQDNNDDLFPLRRGKIGDIEGNIGIGTLNPTEPSDLITSLFIANPNPNNEKEKRKQEKEKGWGFTDIIAKNFKQVEKEVKELESSGRLEPNSLNELNILGHGYKGSCGMGGFVIDNLHSGNSDALNFLTFLSTYTRPSTKVFIQSCNAGDDPYFIHNIADALGVKEVTAPTGLFGKFTGAGIDLSILSFSLGGYITCPSKVPSMPEEIRDWFSIVTQDKKRCNVVRYEKGGPNPWMDKAIEKKPELEYTPYIWCLGGSVDRKGDKKEIWALYEKAKGENPIAGVSPVKGGLHTHLSKMKDVKHRNKLIWEKFIKYYEEYKEDWDDNYLEVLIKKLGCKTSITNPL